MSGWLVAVGWFLGPLIVCFLGYLMGYDDARGKYAPKDGE